MTFLNSYCSKSRWKNRVICLVFKSLSRDMVPKLSKIVSLLQFFANKGKKLKAVRNLCTYICKFKFHSFSKWYWLLCYDSKFWRYLRLNLINFIKFLLSQHFLWYFILQYLGNCCSLKPYKTYYFLKEHDEVFQMEINKLL